jgi:hypothetical protein
LEFLAESEREVASAIPEDDDDDVDEFFVDGAEIEADKTVCDANPVH